MADEASESWNSKELLASGGQTTLWRKGRVIFLQGTSADSTFYIEKGKVKLTTVSAQAKEAVLGLFGSGDFFGDAFLAGQMTRISTAVAMADSSIVRIEKEAFVCLLRTNPAFTEKFLAHLLARYIRMEADLIDQLFNSSEKRLARVLLLLSNYGGAGPPQSRIDKISQHTLAEMIGTTRSHVSVFMNKFRQRGFIDYDDGHIDVHSSLLQAFLQDDVHPSKRCPND
jgi:CRP/FNR family transcriptional regulator, cyclic AMP receptor protein